MVDDEDRNVARRPANVHALKVGTVAVAGRPGFWSWVLIDEISPTSIFVRQITSAQAATHGHLCVPA